MEWAPNLAPREVGVLPWSPDPGELTQVGPLVWLPRRMVLIHGPDSKLDPVEYPIYAFDAHLEIANRQYQIRRLDVGRVDDSDPPITSESLRVLVRQIRPFIIGTVNRFARQSGGEFPVYIPRGEDALRLAHQGPTKEALKAISTVYSMAEAAGERPTRHVTENFGLTRPTAGRWVMKAREAGFLWPSEGPD